MSCGMNFLAPVLGTPWWSLFECERAASTGVSWRILWPMPACLCSPEILFALSYSNSDWCNTEMPELPFKYFCQDQKQFGVTAPGSV